MSINTIEYIENFIKEFNLPRMIAKPLLKTVDDCDEFYIYFYGRNRWAVDDLFTYRHHKIANSNITFEKFVDMYHENALEALETTFLQSFDMYDVEFIIECIASKKTSLEAIYNGFIVNPNKNIMQDLL